MPPRMLKSPLTGGRGENETWQVPIPVPLPGSSVTWGKLLNLSEADSFPIIWA